MTKVLVRISGTQRELNKQTIFSVLEIVRKRVIAQMIARKMPSSGATAQSLEIQEISRGAQLAGADNLQQLITGRRPGRFMPPDRALQYVKDKKIQPRPDKYGRIPSLKSLAYMINRKLATKGSDIYLGKRLGLDVKSIMKEVQPTLKQALIKAGRIEINTAIYKALGKTPHKQIRAV